MHRWLDLGARSEAARAVVLAAALVIMGLSPAAADHAPEPRADWRATAPTGQATRRDDQRQLSLGSLGVDVQRAGLALLATLAVSILAFGWHDGWFVRREPIGNRPTDETTPAPARRADRRG